MSCQVDLPEEPEEDEGNAVAVLPPPTAESEAHMQMMETRVSELRFVTIELRELYSYLSITYDWQELGGETLISQTLLPWTLWSAPNLTRLSFKQGTLSGAAGKAAWRSSLAFGDIYLREENASLCSLAWTALKLVCLFDFLTSSLTTRLYRGRAPRQSVWQFYVLPHMGQSWETMTSVSAGHIILTPTQPVGSRQKFMLREIRKWSMLLEKLLRSVVRIFFFNLHCSVVRISHRKHLEILIL